MKLNEIQQKKNVENLTNSEIWFNGFGDSRFLCANIGGAYTSSHNEIHHCQMPSDEIHFQRIENRIKKKKTVG